MIEYSASWRMIAITKEAAVSIMSPDLVPSNGFLAGLSQLTVEADSDAD
jgi:hypothetical protein